MTLQEELKQLSGITQVRGPWPDYAYVIAYMNLSEAMADDWARRDETLIEVKAVAERHGYDLDGTGAGFGEYDFALYPRRGAAQ